MRVRIERCQRNEWCCMEWSSVKRSGEGLRDSNGQCEKTAVTYGKWRKIGNRNMNTRSVGWILKSGSCLNAICTSYSPRTNSERYTHQSSDAVISNIIPKTCCQYRSIRAFRRSYARSKKSGTKAVKEPENTEIKSNIWKWSWFSHKSSDTQEDFFLYAQNNFYPRGKTSPNSWCMGTAVRIRRRMRYFPMTVCDVPVRAMTLASILV